MDSSEKWWSRKEVAARWGVSADTISRLVANGKLRGMVIPSPSNRRKRKYLTLRFSETECRRFETQWLIRAA